MTRVPLIDLAAQEEPIHGEAVRAIADAAREGSFILGARVEAFERWLAAACGVSHAVGVGSGTDAIELALRALGVGPGDAVITPALSFVASAEAIVTTGARPVFCDVDFETLNLTEAAVAESLARARARGLRARAILPVHLFGLCGPLQILRRLAAGEGLWLVEDAAQAFGARDEQGGPAGSAGDAGCFSFFPTKNLGAWGDAGAVVTSNEAIALRVRSLRAHGAVAPYVHAEAGRNSRLDAVQAAVLMVKAPHVERWAAARDALASRYRAGLHEQPLHLPEPPAPPARHGWHAFVVRTARRDALAAWLRGRGIDTRVYYPVPLHRQPCFASLDEPAMPVAEDDCRTALALPFFPAMSEAQQERVIRAVREFFAR